MSSLLVWKGDIEYFSSGSWNWSNTQGY